jgi:hypothetical protein
MNESFMEAKKSYSSFEMKPAFAIGRGDLVNHGDPAHPVDDDNSWRGRSFAECVYADEKVPFSASNRKGGPPVSLQVCQSQSLT